jgi:type II secretory pathway predicted ATPase ExeA
MKAYKAFGLKENPFISSELGLPGRCSLLAQINEIQDYAFQVYGEGGTIILIIDEAQNLKGAQFDFLRELLNFESNEAKTIHSSHQDT